MKLQRGMFKWLAILLIFAIIFEFVQASPLASARIVEGVLHLCIVEEY